MAEEVVKHYWALDDDGKRDDWFYEAVGGWHNGPFCNRCYTSYCIHCDPEVVNGPCPGMGAE